MIALVGVAILSGYGVALWWLLRREGPWTFTALTALCGIAVALRLVLTHGYPAGLTEDEPKFLGCAVDALERGQITGESCVHIPYLLTSLFEVPLVPLVGANRWSIRTYSMATSVLAVPALFAAGRAMGMRVAPSLLAGGLAAVLPWSIYYGRTILGGELIFHQALLLAGLGLLVWGRGGWAAAVLAAFGLCLLLWDYWAGRAMTGMPLVAAVLATGRRRLWCLAVVALALVGWYPHLATGPLDANVGLSFQGGHGATIAGGFHPGYAVAPWDTAVARTGLALRTFVEPVAEESIFTMRSVAMHPPLLLALAALGILSGPRRGLFLVAAFVAGVAPGVASGSFAISAHRIMMAYNVVALAAAAAVDLLPWRRARAFAAAAVFGAVALWSVSFYFSPRFWSPNGSWSVNAEMTALAEAVAEAPPPRLVLMPQLGFYGLIAAAPAASEALAFENWLPENGQPVMYLFTWQAALLRPHYDRLFPGRVRPVGRDSFLVSLGGEDWSWFRRHGWDAEARCGETVRRARMPFLFVPGIAPRDFPCPGPVTYEWRARWSGPATQMELRFTGDLVVEGAGVALRQSGYEQRLPLALPADSDLTIRLTAPAGTRPSLILLEQSPGGPRVPDWERFTPGDDVGAAQQSDASTHRSQVDGLA